MSGGSTRFFSEKAFAAFIVGSTVFGSLALLNGFTSTLVGMDVDVASWLHHLAVDDPRVTRTLLLVTMLGNGITLTGLTLFASAWLVVANRRLLAVGVGASMIGAALLNFGLKLSFQRPRPTFIDPVTPADGWSFPSGHSMGTTVAVGMLAYVAFQWIEHRRRRTVLVLLAAAWVVLMAFSRMYLGVHYFSDVVGGLAVGMAWLAVSISAIERAKAQRAATLVLRPTVVVHDPEKSTGRPEDRKIGRELE